MLSSPLAPKRQALPNPHAPGPHPAQQGRQKVVGEKEEVGR